MELILTSFKISLEILLAIVSIAIPLVIYLELQRKKSMKEFLKRQKERDESLRKRTTS